LSNSGELATRNFRLSIDKSCGQEFVEDEPSCNKCL